MTVNKRNERELALIYFVVAGSEPFADCRSRCSGMCVGSLRIFIRGFKKPSKVGVRICVVYALCFILKSWFVFLFKPDSRALPNCTFRDIFLCIYFFTFCCSYLVNECHAWHIR